MCFFLVLHFRIGRRKKAVKHRKDCKGFVNRMAGKGMDKKTFLRLVGSHSFGWKPNILSVENIFFFRLECEYSFGL